MTGRISVLVSKDLSTLVQASKSLAPEVAKQNRARTRQVAEVVWREEVTGRVQTRTQARVLGDTARVAVTNTNVTLKAAHMGRLSNGTPADMIKGGAEFGQDPNKVVRQRSRNGKYYNRRAGNVFGRNIRAGKVVFPAVLASVPRVASLWLQTTVRTVAEVFEKAGA